MSAFTVSPWGWVHVVLQTRPTEESLAFKEVTLQSERGTSHESVRNQIPPATCKVGVKSIAEH